MPTVVIISGMRIEIYPNDHPPPHFHVRAGKMRAKFDIATATMLSGNLDRRSIRKVQLWHGFNRSGLMSIWTASRPK